MDRLYPLFQLIGEIFSGYITFIGGAMGSSRFSADEGSLLQKLKDRADSLCLASNNPTDETLGFSKSDPRGKEEKISQVSLHVEDGDQWIRKFVKRVSPILRAYSILPANICRLHCSPRQANDFNMGGCRIGQLLRQPDQRAISVGRNIEAVSHSNSMRLQAN
jgi:hypothetical protein